MRFRVGGGLYHDAMPLEIILVRHGQSEGNRDKMFTGHGTARLTSLGVRQAEAAARAILDQSARATPPGTLPIDEIYASDLPRAVATARPLAHATGLALIETPAIRERDVGEFTGLRFEEVQARWPDGWAAMLSRDPEFRPGGGESHRECAERVGRFLDELMARRAHGRVVLYSHGVAINHMMRHVLGLPPSGAPRAFFQIENCSLQRVQVLGGGLLRIAATNDVAHLAGVVDDGAA